jgi:hypothetical protein
VSRTPGVLGVVNSDGRANSTSNAARRLVTDLRDRPGTVAGGGGSRGWYDGGRHELDALGPPGQFGRAESPGDAQQLAPGSGRRLASHGTNSNGFADRERAAGSWSRPCEQHGCGGYPVV